MPTTGSQRLRSIKTLSQLVTYLRDELDWPIEADSFEEAFFDFEPEEIGLDEEHAAKIKHIKQLRPLNAKQPWGVFFVEFEKKKLPVAVLRRILSHLVVKKRAKASKSQLASWQADDLLFISAFGDKATSEREIAFAHFHQEQGDLPTLHVLGWDGADTILKLEHVDADLHKNLRWPQNPADAAAWRRQWSAPFRHRLNHVIRTADALADILAALARRIRDAAKTLLKVESEKGQLRRLHKAFQTALIHDLTEDDFADTYAQTITYGLLTAAISRTEMSEGRHGTALIAENVTDMVPITNPFLREMLETFIKAGGRKGGIDFDELGIQDVVELLRGDETDLPAILRDFGNKTRGEDPVIHFYEHFLAAYNKKLKVQRGVFYTPQPVVSYIVRSVHELLQTEFDIEDGLASAITWGEMAAQHAGLKIPDGVSPAEPFVQVLDPATGTATFLVEVIDVIHKTMTAQWRKAGKADLDVQRLWNDYVPIHLLPRLHGYELMMASYAIAHMKLPLKLQETGFTAWDNLGEKSRARIYLTNSLEPPQEFSDRLAFDALALAHEAEAVDDIKRHKRFTVVIGNPPYAQYSMNLNASAKAHIEKFRYANGQKIRARNALQLERNLNDDYVKFLGFATELFPTGTGVLGMITNRMFLDSESLVGLREWVANNFEQLCFVDLWGSSEESRRVKRLAADENVFDILQGVAISFIIRRREQPATPNPTKAREVIGTREQKYKLLSTDLDLGGNGWERTQPKPETWCLHREASNSGEVDHEFTLAEVFPQFSTLVASNRDHLVVDVDRDVVIRNVKTVQSFRGSNKQLAEQFGITLKTGWNIDAARKTLAAIRDIDALVRPIEYRCFDRRWIFFHPTLVWQTAPVISNNVLRNRANRVLISLGKNRAETTNGHWVSSTLADKSVVSTRDNASGFPLYIFDEDGKLALGDGSAIPNIGQNFLQHLATRFMLPQEGDFGLPRGLTPDDIFHYAYAVLHCPSYRNRYAEFLKIDFPRLPLAANLELFRALARLGGELVAFHLMDSPKLDHFITTYTGPKNPAARRVGWTDDTVWLDAAATKKGQPATPGTIGFRGVPEAVWNFHIGGYQVCEKWLKDRGPKKGEPGRTLTKDDLVHYQKIVVALNETIRLMKEIDEVIEKHGGWPGAFITNMSATVTDNNQGLTAAESESQYKKLK